MKLQPGERSLLATFRQDTHAAAAERELRQAGFNDVQLDQIGRFGLDDEAEFNPLGIRSEGSETAPVLGGRGQMLDDDARVLLNATPDASGMSGPLDMGGQESFMVALVTSEDRLNEAVSIIQKHGGRV